MRTFLQLDVRSQALTLVAVPLLGLMRLLVVLVPFPVVRRVLGISDAGCVDVADATPELTDSARRVGRSVERAARHTPWRSDCYPQALAAHLLMKVARVPHRVSFGLRRAETGLTAHAWVSTRTVAVTGGNPVDYTVVGTFTWAPRGAS